MPKANRPSKQAGRRDPRFDLDLLDDTSEMTTELPEACKSEAGELAVKIRETATKVKKLGAMNALQQMQHAPDLIAEAMGQMAYALELLDLNNG